MVRKLAWTEDYAVEKMLPVLTRWQVKTVKGKTKTASSLHWLILPFLYALSVQWSILGLYSAFYMIVTSSSSISYWSNSEYWSKNWFQSRNIHSTNLSCLTVSLFENRKELEQNSRPKYMTLIQNIMENRLRHASGPVHNHSVTWIPPTPKSASPVFRSPLYMTKLFFAGKGPGVESSWTLPESSSTFTTPNHRLRWLCQAWRGLRAAQAYRKMAPHAPWEQFTG